MINKEPSQVKYQKAEMLGVVATGPVALLSADMGLPVRVELWGGGSFAVTIERSGDGGVSWQPITAAGVVVSSYTGTVSEAFDDETQRGAQYRANVTAYTSGTLNIRLSQ